MKRLPLLLLLAQILLAADVSPDAKEPAVVCSASAVAIPFGGTVTLNAGARPVPGHTFTYTWTTNDSGTITPGQGGEATWKDLDGGLQSATVTVTDGQTTIGRCGVQVLGDIASARGEGERTPLRAFLNGDEPEPAGLGLYSYVIFGKADEARNLAVLTSLTAAVPGLLASANTKERKDVNGNFIPLTAAEAPSDPKKLLPLYNYTRAAAWRAKVPVKGTGGTFLVSSKTPLADRKPGDEILVIDLSLVPVKLVPVWVDKFVNQAAQMRFSDASALQFLLRVRLELELFTTGVTNVKAAAKLVAAK